ncbi:MAG TPA: FAD-dependent monooxygenase [Devosia sp.]|nr:FAD-dependent monooxygenase [Devosia sp.]
MPGTGQIYLVAGAGISGLTLALALAKFGAKVVVLERASAISEFGAGLQISPNARLVLDRLGLNEAIAAHSLEPVGIDIYPFRGTTPLVTLELGAAMRERFGSPYAVMHRADLAGALYQATRRFANIDIQFGVRHWDAISTPQGVSVTFEEADGHRRTVRGKAFVGADGVHSHTRRKLLNGPDADYRQRVAWRTLLPFDSVGGQLALDRVSVLFAPGYHAVCYPLPHRQQVNIALFAKAPQEQSEAGTNPPLPRRSSPSPRLKPILDAARDNWTPWPLYTVETPHWHAGNIGIIGDAAHAMLPFQAQGAAMGIEDAAVLAPLLVRATDAQNAFASFAAMRQPRVARVAHTSQANGRIFHMVWPFSAARNMVIAMQGSRGHLRRLEWLYGHDAG